MKRNKFGSAPEQNAGTHTRKTEGASSPVGYADALFSMLRAVLDGKEIPPLPLTQAFFNLCVKQQLTGFLYRAIQGREDIPPEAVERVRRYYTVSVGQQVQQDFYRGEIFARLHAAGIPYLPLKGICLRELYPSPDLRFSCDIDFFYPGERRGEVNRILTDLGFCQENPDAHNDSFSLGAVHVEPHFALNNDAEQYEQYYADIWSRLLTDDGIEYRFTDEDFYCYLLLHMYKHMLNGGTGVRSVIDLGLWNRAHPTMDRDYLTKEWTKLGLSRFAYQMERLFRVWLCGETGDSDTCLLTEYILAGGAYGSFAQGSQVSVARKKRWKRLSFLWRRVFPPYRQIFLRYPWLRKVPFLLPLGYLLRWVQTLFSPNRRKIQMDLEIASSIAGEEAEKAERIRELIG